MINCADTRELYTYRANVPELASETNKCKEGRREVRSAVKQTKGGMLEDINYRPDSSALGSNAKVKKADGRQLAPAAVQESEATNSPRLALSLRAMTAWCLCSGM